MAAIDKSQCTRSSVSLAAVITLLLVVLIDLQCVHGQVYADYGEGGRQGGYDYYDYGGYDAGYDVGGGDDAGNSNVGVDTYDYGGGDPDPPQQERDPIVCYACHYTKTANALLGDPNCDEPFEPEGITQVPCTLSEDGQQCAKTRTYLDDGVGFMIIRSCMPECVERYEKDSVVECCDGNLCNDDVHIADTANIAVIAGLAQAVATFCAALSAIMYALCGGGH